MIFVQVCSGQVSIEVRNFNGSLGVPFYLASDTIRLYSNDLGVLELTEKQLKKYKENLFSFYFKNERDGYTYQKDFHFTINPDSLNKPKPIITSHVKLAELIRGKKNRYYVMLSINGVDPNIPKKDSSTLF
jgi:hypothetical protein